MMRGTLWRLAVRNARRHRAQAIAAAATVAVATTVLAASLAAGQAAENGIKQVGFDILGEVDELVRSEGDLYFPQAAAERFATEVRARTEGVAVSPTVTHVVVASTSAGRTEPDTLLYGLPPGEAGFGQFEMLEGSADLTRGAVLNERLAERLDARPGDTLVLRYARPVDPFVPTIHTFNGTVTGASAPGPVPLPGLPGDPVASTHTFEVPAGATRIIAVLGWGSASGAVDLDLALVAPSGDSRANTNGTTTAPDAPAFLNATAEAGTWTARVTAKAAADQAYQLFVVVLEPATSIEELQEARRRLASLPELAERFERDLTSERAEVTVVGVAAMDGKGGLFGENGVFVALGEAQRLEGRPGEVNLVRVSNPGDVRGGLGETRAVMPALQAALNTTKTAFPDDAAVQALKVEPTKEQIVRRAELAGEGFTRFLSTLSSFTIMAGVLLVVNLFTMLGEERRIELSVMRALGLGRRHLVGSMTLEGALYTLPGAPIGGVLGIGLAWVLIKVVNEFVASQDALPIPFIIEPWTPVVAALLAMAFTLLAIAVTGVRLSRLHIAAGLKGLPDPRARGRARAPSVLLGVGALSTAAFLPTGFYTLLILGPAAFLYGIGLLVGASWRAPKRRFLASMLVIPYGLWTVLAFDEVSPGETPILAPVRGTVLVVLAVIALLNFPGLTMGLKALGRRTGRFAPATAVALAYPSTRQLRTGLTASMFALVLLVLAVFSTFFGVLAVDPDREAGGYDIYAETSLPVDDLEAWSRTNLGALPPSLAHLDRVDSLVVARIFGGETITIDGETPEYQGPPIDWFYGVDAGFASFNGYELASRLDRFETDRAAYEALVAEPGNVVVSRAYDFDEVGRLGRIEGGETLTLELASQTLELTVLGAQEQLYLGGVFLPRATVDDLFPSHGSGFLMTVVPGEDPELVAAALERDFQEMGLDAGSIRAEALELQELNARLFTVLQVFLGLGLVIGVASLGIVTAKSALEREQELGVLRALGMPARHVTLSLVAEALMTAVIGIVPGILIGVAVSYAAYLAFFASSGAPFLVPWTSILVLSAVSLAATLLSTLPPARRAARTELARAVRITL